MTPDERLERYGDIVVRIGANVQAGQGVVITAQVEHAPVARAIAAAAYRAGARRVYVEYGDLHVRRAAIEHGPEDELGLGPAHVVEWMRGWADERPAVIQLTGNPDPRLMNGLDPARVAKSERREVREAWLPLVAGRKLNWTIVSGPNAGGRTSFRRARPRAALGGRRHGDATRRTGSSRGLAAACRAPEGSRPRAQRALVRRDSLPWSGDGSHHRPPAGVSVGLRDVRDRDGDRAHPEPADRRGLHQPGLAARGGGLSARPTHLSIPAPRSGSKAWS